MRFAVYHNLFVFVNLSFSLYHCSCQLFNHLKISAEFPQGRKPYHKVHYKHPSLKLQTNKSIFTNYGNNIDKKDGTI